MHMDPEIHSPTHTMEYKNIAVQKFTVLRVLEGNLSPNMVAGCLNGNGDCNKVNRADRSEVRISYSMFSTTNAANIVDPIHASIVPTRAVVHITRHSLKENELKMLSL